MLGVALARSAPGQRWPEPGEAVNLIVSGTGERLAGMLRQPDRRDTDRRDTDRRDTAAVLAVAGPPVGLLMLSPLRWEVLVLVPVIGVVAGFAALRLYERRLRRAVAMPGDHPASPPPG